MTKFHYHLIELSVPRGTRDVFDCGGEMIQLSVLLRASFKFGGRSLNATTNILPSAALWRIFMGLEWYGKPISLERTEESTWRAEWKFCYPSDDSGWEIIRYNPGKMLTTFDPRTGFINIDQLHDSDSRPVGPP